MKGLKSFFKTEVAFSQNLIVFIINTIDIFFVTNKVFMAVLVFAGLINTAIEYIVDLVTNEHKPLAEEAKDVGSVLVFLAVINLVVCWLVYFFK